MMEIICKTDGACILVDDEDFPLLSRFPWYRGGSGEHPMTFFYGKKGTGKPVYMHQIIMGGAVNIDHIDRNVLNMQKSNLRIADHQLNGWNKGKPQRKGCKNTSQYKGVRYTPLRGKPRWQAYLKYVAPGAHKSTGHMVYIGFFDDEVAAARAYNEKVRELRGEWAYLNPLPAANGVANV